METLDFARSVVEILEEKKGENIVLMDIQGVASFADYFVICSGTSDRMLDSLAKATLEKVRELHKVHGRVEGEAGDGWMLVDFGDVIVHLFSPEQRDYYGLEELWNKGKLLVHLQ